MGTEIDQTTFADGDFERFGERLHEETRLIRDWAEGGRLHEGGYSIGFEIECWLLDHNYVPTPINESLLRKLDHPLVVPELSRFNVELNSEPLRLAGDALRRAREGIETVWGHCNRVAHSMDANMVMIGTLPTIRDKDLSLANISHLKRYDALNHEVLRQRGGRPIRVVIDGEEHLDVEHHDVMLEAATTSFQVHLQTPASLAHRYANASALASGPLIALAGNAPFLFGRRLWHETRIPLFEQSVDMPGLHPSSKRVCFGNDWVRRSMIDVFEDNVREYPTLLPLLFDSAPDELRHLRLHNGTIWRWNRPLVGFEANGTPHLRLEFRVLPAGPSILDMVANAAFHVGLVHDLVHHEDDETLGMPFSHVRENFYRGARDGPDAQLHWGGETARAPSALLIEELIPRAARGLRTLNLDGDDIDTLLDVMACRAASGRTGSVWQREALRAYDDDRFRLMAAYCERQRSGAPVHEWGL